MFSFCFHSTWKMHAIFLMSWCHITVHNFIWFLHYSFKKFGQPKPPGSSQEQQWWFCPPTPSQFNSKREECLKLVPSVKNCGARTPNWSCTVNFRDTTSLLNTLCFLILLDIRMSQHPQHNAYVAGFSIFWFTLHTSYGQNHPRIKISQMLKPHQLFVLSERIQC